MNYPIKKISDLFSDIKIGGTPSRGSASFFGGSNLWVSIKDMNGQSIITSTAERLTDKGIACSNCKLVSKGSLLFSFKLTVGKVAFAGSDLYTNEAIAAFDPKEAEENGIDLHYLSIVLPIAAKTDTTKNSMGASLLSKDRIYDLAIPVPNTIDEQKEIAKRLLSRLKEIKIAKEAALCQGQNLKFLSIKQQSRALEILKNIPRVPLSEYLEGIEAGKSIQTTELLATKEELGVLKVSAVSWDYFQPDEAKSVIGNYYPPEEHRVKKGDLLITRANGTLKLVGAGVLVKEDYPNRLLSDKTLRLKLRSNSIMPDYVLQVLKLPQARKYIEENATGSQSMRNISQKTIYKIPIPQADETQQKEIIELMQVTRTEVKKGEEALKLMLGDLDLLPIKLLEEAFNEFEYEQD